MQVQSARLLDQGETLLALPEGETQPLKEASLKEQQLAAAIEAWRMGREMMQRRKTSKIPQMHPGSWRTGR